MSALAEAIDALIEANVALRKRRALARPERLLAAAMQRAFTAEGRAFLTKLSKLQSRFPPEIREVAKQIPWEKPFDNAALETLQAFVQPLDEFTARSLLSGMTAAIADLSVETSFTLEHPAAVDYLRDHGLEQAKKITGTTREGLRSLLAQAGEEGWSYDKTAREIRNRYAEFSRTRAKNIAVYELGASYEEGGLVVARDLQSAGLEMEHAWGTSQDDRVRPEHRANEAEGFIPLEQAFSSGHLNPPTDPKCRCYSKLRRKSEE